MNHADRLSPVPRVEPRRVATVWARFLLAGNRIHPAGMKMKGIYIYILDGLQSFQKCRGAMHEPSTTRNKVASRNVQLYTIVIPAEMPLPALSPRCRFQSRTSPWQLPPTTPYAYSPALPPRCLCWMGPGWMSTQLQGAGTHTVQLFSFHHREGTVRRVRNG